MTTGMWPFVSRRKWDVEVFITLIIQSQSSKIIGLAVNHY